MLLKDMHESIQNQTNVCFTFIQLFLFLTIILLQGFSQIPKQKRQHPYKVVKLKDMCIYKKITLTI